MRISRVITAVDSHTAGEPTRVVTGGIPHIPGTNMQKKKEWVQKNRDHLRKMLMWEPRGHRDMFGAIITEPTSNDADIGIIFMDNDGYLDMCGHGSIGAATVLVETGMIECKNETEGEKEIILDTPAGKVHSRIKIENGKVKQVTIRNVPSFLYSSIVIKLGSTGDVPVDIAYGGNFFALVNAQRLNTKIEPGRVMELIELGLDIRKKVNYEIKIIHPTTGKLEKVELVEIFEDTSPPRNVVIFGSGQVDRCPCGTGTSAKMATLYANNRLKVGEVYRYRSIMGTEFQGKIVKEAKIAGYKAIIPEFTGSAYITGIQQLFVDEDDPFKYGFKLLQY